MRIRHHVTSEPTTVFQCLKKHFQLENSQAEELVALGAIYSNKKRVLSNVNLPKGTYLRIHLQPKRFPIENVNWDQVKVDETQDFLVVNKPSGIPVHATLDNQRDNLLTRLRERTGEALYVTQRLDVPASGLMVFAKNPDYQRQFNQWLVDRKVQKRYAALVEVAPALGTHIHFMEAGERSPKRVSLQESPGTLRCELSVLQVTPRTDGKFEVEIDLHTGRTHQIRVQLSALGSPILGDKMYRSRSAYETGDRIALFSTSIQWPNPKGEGPWSYALKAPWQTAL